MLSMGSTLLKSSWKVNSSPLRGDLYESNMALEICGHNNHIPEAEWHIFTLKERVRSIYNTLPFKYFPVQIVIKMIHFCTFWLNSFPPIWCV
jgi:hypothetical protein